MKYALWGLQILLALAFGMAGSMKLMSTPDELLAAGMTWVNYMPAGAEKFIGASELLGAIGLVLPAATRIVPVLTPIAAALLAVVMGIAGALHATHGEMGALPANAVLGGLAAFVAWGRFAHSPIASR